MKKYDKAYTRLAVVIKVMVILAVLYMVTNHSYKIKITMIMIFMI